MKINKDLIISDTTTSLGGVVTNINGLKGTILWTNPNPTSAFAAQTVTLNELIENYDMWEILYKQSSNSNLQYSSGKTIIDNTRFTGAISGIISWRDVNVSGTSLTFGTGHQPGTTDDDILIPLYIIGYNTGLFN